jgi:sialidase-1
MNRYQRAVLAGISFAWLLSAMPSIHAFAAHAQLTEVTVYRENDRGYFIHRIPALFTTSKGTLLAFCEARTGSAADAAATDVVLKRSLDGGKTWSAAQVVAHFPNYTVGNPAPVQDRKTGVIWLPLTANPAGVTETEICNSSPRGTRTVWMTHSDDDGVTWAPAQEITATTKKPDWTWYATGPGNGIQLENGRMVIPCDYRLAGTQEFYSHVIYSDDDGQTWKLGGSPGPQTNECAVVQLTDGSLLLNMRSYAGKHLRAISYSKDGGLTWSPVQLDPALIEPVCEGTLIRYTLAQNGGKNRLLFANPADTVRDKMTVRLSYDEGKTWPVSRLLYDGFSEYSSLTILPDHTIGLLYTRGPGKPTPEHRAYAPQGTEIVFAHFNLEWLTNGKDHLARN